MLHGLIKTSGTRSGNSSSNRSLILLRTPSEPAEVLAFWREAKGATPAELNLPLLFDPTAPNEYLFADRLTPVHPVIDGYSSSHLHKTRVMKK